MACTPQDLIDTFPCFDCLTEQQASAAMVALTCIAAGGIPPDTDVIVIGGEGTDVIIGGESGGDVGAE